MWRAGSLARWFTWTNITTGILSQEGSSPRRLLSPLGLPNNSIFMLCWWAGGLELSLPFCGAHSSPPNFGALRPPFPTDPSQRKKTTWGSSPGTFHWAEERGGLWLWGDSGAPLAWVLPSQHGLLPPELGTAESCVPKRYSRPMPLTIFPRGPSGPTLWCHSTHA